MLSAIRDLKKMHQVWTEFKLIQSDTTAMIKDKASLSEQFLAKRFWHREI
ncbi:hypothetical protein AAKU64_001219 [Undibacterium sp. GrIS 1.8]